MGGVPIRVRITDPSVRDERCHLLAERGALDGSEVTTQPLPRATATSDVEQQPVTVYQAVQVVGLRFVHAGMSSETSNRSSNERPDTASSRPMNFVPTGDRPESMRYAVDG